MAKNLKKLKEIFFANATPEEKAVFELKERVKTLEKKPAVIRETPVIKTEIKEVVKEVAKYETGEKIVEKINSLEIIPEKQVDFLHVKNFPWHLTKGQGGDGGFTGYGAYDLNIKAITLGQITANQNDYATGLGSWFRILSDAARTITGFEGGTDGRGFILTNVGSFNITLANQSVSSATAYRIITGTGADITLLPDDDIWLLYDSTTERWRIVERGSGSIASSTIDEIAYFNTATTIASLTTVTYPNLTEISYIKGLTSSAQTQLDLKSPIASPIFTGTVTIPTPFTLGAVSVLPTGTELNFVDGVTSNIQTQLDGKQATGSYGLTTSPLSQFAATTSL